MTRVRQILAAASLMVAAPAAAQAINVGMAVVDPSGGVVGTVASVQGPNLLIKTDKHEALLPKTSFAASEGKLLFAMSQAQLNAAVEGGMAAANAAVTPGATVNGAAGTKVGVLDAVQSDGVIIALESGAKVKIDRSGVRGNPDGTVSIGLTADQIETQVKQTAATAGQ
jgi:preprotein translocase subunit YajC